MEIPDHHTLYVVMYIDAYAQYTRSSCCDETTCVQIFTLTTAATVEFPRAQLNRMTRITLAKYISVHQRVVRFVFVYYVSCRLFVECVHVHLESRVFSLACLD